MEATMLPELTVTALTLETNAHCLEALTGDFTEADWAVRDACGHQARRGMRLHRTPYRRRAPALP